MMEYPNRLRKLGRESSPPPRKNIESMRRSLSLRKAPSFFGVGVFLLDLEL
jgi:hypothetical protein